MLRNLLKGTKEKEEEKEKKNDASSPPMSVSTAARAAYNDTLRKYHGLLTAAAFSAALSVRKRERERERKRKSFFKCFFLIFYFLSVVFSLSCSRLSSPSYLPPSNRQFGESSLPRARLSSRLSPGAAAAAAAEAAAAAAATEETAAATKTATTTTTKPRCSLRSLRSSRDSSPSCTK